LLASEWLVNTFVIPNDPFQQHVSHFFRDRGGNAVFGDSIAAHGFIGRKDFPNRAYPQESPAQLMVKARGLFYDKIANNVIVEASITLLYRRDSSARNYADIFLTKRLRPIKVVSLYHRERLQRYWRKFLTNQPFDSVYKYFPYGGVKWLKPPDPLPKGVETEAALTAAKAIAISQISAIKRGETPTNSRNYVKLINYLKSRGANICLVEWPVHPAFAQASAGLSDYDEGRQFFRELAEEKGLTYRSYWNAIASKADFEDHTHLTSLAAERFTTRVVDDCFQGKF